jgi:DNA-binding GntR family transcriptional regulator
MPHEMVIAILRDHSKTLTIESIAELFPNSSLAHDQSNRFLSELIELGILSKSRRGYRLTPWTPSKIVEHLSVAGAISTLVVYQMALHRPTANFTHLEAINSNLNDLDQANPKNLLQGAYLDYQLHLECVRLSENEAAYDAYLSIAPPALWLTAANFFDVDDAQASLDQHDNLIMHMRGADAVRAQEAAQYHFEDAITQIAAASMKQKQSYPATA